jgi:redox-sensing transcriptional repressor
MPKGVDPTSESNPPPRNGSEPRLSRATVGRLSLYLRRLEGLLRDGTARTSSSLLGEAIGVTDAQVRKDLAGLSLGHPGIGYDVAELVAAIRRVLGIDREWRAALVGVGNLARALLGYHGFLERGFRIVALFDADPTKIGQHLNNLEVHSTEQMASVIPAVGAELGILTVPAEMAQPVADALVAAGVKGLLNFAPGVLRVPAGVSVVSVDLTVQLEQLAFLVQMAHWGRGDS